MFVGSAVTAGLLNVISSDVFIQDLPRSLFSCQITIEKESGQDVTAPKHGKVDPNNAPHVGGNQWAGGTGDSCSGSSQCVRFRIRVRLTSLI